MKWPKLAFTIALAVLFVGTAFMSIFGIGRILDATLKTYVLRYESCSFRPVPVLPRSESDELIAPEPKEECRVDYNQTKNDIAGGLSLMIAGLPVALLSFRQLRTSVKENSQAV